MSDVPERIWIECSDECPYFYVAAELADASPPLAEFVRADIRGCELDEITRLRAELEAERERWRLPLHLIHNGHKAVSMNTLQKTGGSAAVGALKDILRAVEGDNK